MSSIAPISTRYLTLGEIAEHTTKRYGHTIAVWQIRRLFQRGFLPEPARIRSCRVVPVDDLATIERALREAGYLPADAKARKAVRDV